MSIQIQTIPGQRQSVCNNDAYSIVSTEDDGSSTSLGIVTESELQGKDKNEITSIFARAAKENGASDTELQETAEAARAFAAEYLDDNYLDHVDDTDPQDGDDITPGTFITPGGPNDPRMGRGPSFP